MGYIERRSLKWINNYRVARGGQPLARLPRGERRDPNGCVVHRALSDLYPHNSVTLGSVRVLEYLNYSPHVHESTIKTPWYMKFMIITFDMGLRRKQDARIHGHDTLELTSTYSKDVLSLREKFEMWREKKRVEKEMAQERAAEFARQQAARLLLKQQWDEHYEKVWAEECQKPADVTEQTNPDSELVLYDPELMTQIAERRDEFLEVVGR